jgi:hypothetical protein
VAGARGTTLGRAAKVAAGAVGAVPETTEPGAGAGKGVAVESADSGGAEVTGDEGAGAGAELDT